MSLRLPIFFFCALAVVLQSFAQGAAGARVKDFQAPTTDNAGRRSLIKGANAEPAGNGILKITAPHVDNYRADGALDTTLEAAECFFDYNASKDVWSAKEFSMKSADGRISLQGVGFRFLAANSQLTVSNQVQALVRPTTNATVVRISADSLEYHTDSVIFTGRVHVVDAQGEVRCRVLHARFDEKNDLKELEAIDDVIISQKETEARGRRAVYTRSSGLLRLFENTRWRMGDREGQSQLLVLDRTNNTLRAENSVRMTLPSSLLATNTASKMTNSANTNFVTISADTFDFAQTNTISRGPIAIFNGNVHAVDPQATLDCELLTIFFDNTNRLTRAVADRNVQIARPDGSIKGSRAIFEKEEITIQGAPTWRLDQKNGSADLLVFNPRTREIRALKNVRMEFPSGSATNLFQISTGPNNPTASSATNLLIVTATYFTNSNNVATFSDNVRVTEPRGQLDAQRIALFFNATNQVIRVLAEGDVILTEQKSQAIGQRADYDVTSARLRLTGAPRVFGEDRQIIAREFIVDRAQNTFQPLAPYHIELRKKK